MKKVLKIRTLTFWPAFLVLLVASVMSIMDGAAFAKSAGAIVAWILKNFSWGFTLGALFSVVLCVVAFFSPLGLVRIGGDKAEPLLKPGNWIMVALCTTVAAGLLFWAAAEPLYHYYGPPKTGGIVGHTPEAARFALSTMFLHWSFTPYAIYCVPATVFALVYHNLGKAFSIGSMLYPLFGNRVYGKTGQVIDGIALSAFSSSMASSLATGILAIMGGLAIFGFEKNGLTLAGIGLVIGLTVIASSVSGLKRGITWLSTANTYVFIGIALVVLFFGPTLFIVNFGIESLGVYLDNFFQKSLITGASEKETWALDWTIFYFASWMAWAPLTAMFLGKIARGYTVRQFILVNLVLPSIFAIVWTSIFSGATIFYDMSLGGAMKLALDKQGYESVVFKLFEQLPMSMVMIVAFVVATYLSYSTAADSTTDAMANMCLESSDGARMTDEEMSGSTSLMMMKVIWGTLIGVVAVTMLVFADVGGIKQLAYIGGLPALLLMLALLVAFVKLIFNTKELGIERDIKDDVLLNDR